MQLQRNIFSKVSPIMRVQLAVNDIGHSVVKLGNMRRKLVVLRCLNI